MGEVCARCKENCAFLQEETSNNPEFISSEHCTILRNVILAAVFELALQVNSPFFTFSDDIENKLNELIQSGKYQIDPNFFKFSEPLNFIERKRLIKELNSTVFKQTLEKEDFDINELECLVVRINNAHLVSLKNQNCPFYDIVKLFYEKTYTPDLHVSEQFNAALNLIFELECLLYQADERKVTYNSISDIFFNFLQR